MKCSEYFFVFYNNQQNIQPIKYIKPKFASNMEEAMKIMKIRKQLAKLERENQLALSQIAEQSALIKTEPAGKSKTFYLS